MAQQIDAVVRDFGGVRRMHCSSQATLTSLENKEFEEPSNGPSVSSVNVTAKDLMQHFRDTFNIHPGIFKLVP